MEEKAVPDEVLQAFVDQYPHPNSTEMEKGIFKHRKMAVQSWF